ncbi:MAG: hypothetical protein ACYC18_03250 [Gammaproteobacteria bacterium]
MDRHQSIPEGGHLTGEPLELLDVDSCEGFEACCARVGEAHAYDTVIVRIPFSED